MADIVLDGVSKRFDDGYEAVKDMNLEIKDGEFVILVGPSGCGKSTALRMIAGLEDITDGELRIGGDVVNQYAPKDRDIAMVFQNYALYPHMSVRDNMAFPLKLAKVPDDEIKTKVEEAAKILDLEQHLDRKPANLSGGQRQRVAMGRAIVRDPKAFLMDEPLSNLDAKLRVQMRTEVSRIQKQLGDDDGLRHPRPDRGDDARRPGRGDARRRAAAGRLAGGALLEPDQPVRRRIHRLAGDELHAGASSRATRRSCRSATSACPRSCARALGDAGGSRDVIAGVAPGELRGRDAGRRRPRPRHHLQGEDRGGRVDGLRALRLLRARVRGRSQSQELAELAEDSGAAEVPGSGEDQVVARLDAASKVSAARRPSSGSTRPSSTSSTRRAASASAPSTDG